MLVPEWLSKLISLFFPHNHQRGGSIIAGYEVIGSHSTSELLSAIEQVAEKAKEGLQKLFPLEDDSFRVSGKGNTKFPPSA